MNNSTFSSPTAINDENHQLNDNNNVDMDSGSNQTVIADENTMIHSEKTGKLYGRKQEEFKRWCSKVKKFEDGTIVSDEKLCSFLTDYILPRGNINKKPDENGAPVPLGKESFLSYVKAMVDLFSQRKSLNINHYPHPKGPLVKAFLDTLTKPKTKRKRKRDSDNDDSDILENQRPNMDRNIEALIPELTNFINTGFSSLVGMLHTMQAQLYARHQQVLQSQIDTRNALADSLLKMSTLLRQSGSTSDCLELSNSDVATTITFDSSDNTNNSNDQSSDDIIQYKMSRNISNVNDVWREYTVGLPGLPAVRNLEAEYKTKWRKNRSESKFFTTRSVLYREIEKIVEERNISCEESANILEAKRVELGASLDKLIKIIKNNTS